MEVQMYGLYNDAKLPSFIEAEKVGIFRFKLEMKYSTDK
jgi:hypothetical protein